MEKILTVLCLSFLMAFSSFAQENNAQQFYNIAKQKAEAGALAEAAQAYNKAGFAWVDAGNTAQAAEAFLQSAALNKKLGNYNAVAYLYNTLGRIYADQGDYSKAINYLEQGLEIARAHGAHSDIASVLMNLGEVEAENGSYQQAITHTQEALSKALEKNNLTMVRDAYKKLSAYYEQTGDEEKAAENFERYSAFDHKVQQQKEARAKARMQKMEEESEQIRQQKEAQEKALQQQQQQLNVVKDSLADYEKLSKKQQIQIDLLNKKKRIQELELQQEKAQRREERIIGIVLLIGLLLVLGFSVMLFRVSRARKKANEQLQQQNEEIQRQNKKIMRQRTILERSSQELEAANKRLEDQNVKITNSINYAQTIQQAMLPSALRLRSFLEDSFVLFRPKDIVSGDFYWFTVPDGENQRSMAAANMATFDENHQELLISAVDCTGHGVPGAFMSFIGYSLLNEIVNAGLKAPDTVLQELDRRLKLVLQQDEKESKDGMDMAMLLVDMKANTVSFAGAHNPLLYVQNGEVHEIRGTNRPIGGKRHMRLKKGKKSREEPFQKETLSIDSPTEMYIFSDGYMDQFGGPRNRKFMQRRFREMIGQIHHKPMDEQHRILIKRLEEWQGEHPQIDDILVIGFRLNPK